ncbi:DUF484 family protein [Polynucleobacter necessarius]|uniref:DUF484 family protein n=1 Tax=Polynucleobacter necessarius TaxID=576610 RepID=UPI002F9505F4
MRIKHPHEDRTISLQERQMTVLRTQNQELNRRLSEMLHFGSRNDKTQQSLVAWLLRLMRANNKAEVFEVESAQSLSPNSAFGPWVDTPLCGSAKELAAASVDLLASQTTIEPEWQSMVAIGLPLGKSTGTTQSPAVLLLASKDESRFTADMGAFYLRQIAELTAAALDRIQAYEIKGD